MKTIIAGSRDIDDYGVLEEAIAESGFEITAVVSGGYRGVDHLGEAWARAHGMEPIVIRADWSRHGNAAGPIRNGQMAEIAEALIAIPAGNSRGTTDMIAKAQKRGLRTYVHSIR